MAGDKVLAEAAGTDASGHAVRGYEMHMGRTAGPDCARPFLTLAGRPDGAVSADGRVMGCYLHGLFASDPFRHAFLDSLRPGRGDGVAYEALVEEVLDRLAGHLETHMDLNALWEMATPPAG